MNIRIAIMAAVISSTAVFTAYGVDVSIPGANPKMPAVVYSDNIVNQTTVDELRKDLSEKDLRGTCSESKCRKSYCLR